MAQINNFDECLNVLRLHNRDLYVATLFAPEAARAPLSALWAFQTEIGRIRDAISEPMPGEIRLQWWRDSIGPDKPESGSPVLDALNQTIAANDLPVDVFERLLDARIFDMYSDAMATKSDAQGYAGETRSVIFQLAMMIIQQNTGRDFKSSDFGAIAGHAGVAEFWTQASALMPKHRAQQQIFFPKDMLAEIDLTPEIYLSGACDQGSLVRLGQRAEAEARKHLAEVQNAWLSIPTDARSAFLPACLLRLYLAGLGKRSNPQVLIADINPISRLWNLWKAKRGNFPAT